MYDSIETIILSCENENCKRINGVQLNIDQPYARRFKRKGNGCKVPACSEFSEVQKTDVREIYVGLTLGHLICQKNPTNQITKKPQPNQKTHKNPTKNLER